MSIRERPDHRLMDGHAYDEWFALWTDDAGRNRHQLRRVGAGLAMVSKTMLLVDNNEVMNNLTF